MESIKDKNVEVFITNNAGRTYIESGVITNIILGNGSGYFIELNSKTIINSRYIMKIDIKD